MIFSLIKEFIQSNKRKILLGLGIGVFLVILIIVFKAGQNSIPRLDDVTIALSDSLKKSRDSTNLIRTNTLSILDSVTKFYDGKRFDEEIRLAKSLREKSRELSKKNDSLEVVLERSLTAKDSLVVLTEQKRNLTTSVFTLTSSNIKLEGVVDSLKSDNSAVRESLILATNQIRSDSIRLAKFDTLNSGVQRGVAGCKKICPVIVASYNILEFKKPLEGEFGAGIGLKYKDWIVLSVQKRF